MDFAPHAADAVTWESSGVYTAEQLGSGDATAVLVVTDDYSVVTWDVFTPVYE